MHRPPTLAFALLFALLPALGCQGGPKTRIDPEAQLQLHREAAFRWYQMDDLDRAEDQASKALDLAPDDRQLKMMLGWIRLRRGRVEDVLVAERVFRNLAEDDDDYRAHLGLGGALERKGASYLQAADDAYDAGEAVEFAKKGRLNLAESVKAYKRTLELSDGNVRALSGLQRNHSYLGNYEKSLEYAERHRRIVSGDRLLHRNLLEQPGTTAQEEDRLRRQLQGDNRALIANNLHAAPLLLELERHAKALELLEEVLSIDPEQASAYALRAQALMALERYDEAVESLDEFLALSTDLDFTHPDVQRAFQLRSTCERALAALRR